MSTNKQDSNFTKPDLSDATNGSSAEKQRDSAEIWPPAPGPQHKATSGEKTEITHCPACSRKLLTQSSALCNWCGAKINDPDYQALAAESRQIRDQNERQQIESVVQEESRYGILGRLKRHAKQNSGGLPPLG